MGPGLGAFVAGMLVGLGRRLGRIAARVSAALGSSARRVGGVLRRALRAVGRGLASAVRGLLDRLRPGRIYRAWKVLGLEQRAAATGSVLLVASTPGPFSFVEAAVIIVALAVIALVYGRSEGRPFHLPFGDGGWVAVAGAWCAVLILSRLLERPLGQTLLALASAAILVLAGVRQHVRRPADDLPRFVRRSVS
ncbi:MAG: hypothetical protein WKF31_11175 [Thermoleophilaceae bacterium]